MPLREAIVDLGGGGRDGSDLEAVLIGGPMGSIVTPDRWDVPICFAAMARAGINLGHGGLVAIPKGTDWSALLRHLVAFMRDESCGKCTPCRLGSQRLHAVIAAGLPERDLPETLGILSLMRDASLCAFGRETPGPVETVLRIMGRIGASGPTP
jgi:NADH:ubiquinone oxidoreductase subunit F (NADH-binding)